MMHNYACDITGFPMPPSVNKLKSVFRGRMIKSEVYRSYERAVEIWVMQNQQMIQEARVVASQVGPGRVLSVTVNLKFPYSSIISKERIPKRMDSDNRIKALFDVLSQILWTDDKFFWEFYVKKSISYSSPDSSVDLTIELVQLAPPLLK